MKAVFCNVRPVTTMTTIRPGVFGDTFDVFDNYGNKVAVIRPGVMAGLTHQIAGVPYFQAYKFK